jgi:hypothetical protein
LENWVSKESDINRCMGVGDLAKSRNRGLKSGAGIDELVMPWNYDRNDQWVQPSYQQVCGFNLLAQGYFPDGFLAGGLAPPVWAGDTDLKHKIAGALDGPAATAANNLSRYGRTRSRSSCSYASAQCFASLAVEVMGDTANQPSEWQSQLESKIIDASREKTYNIDTKRPWCALVHPYLGLSGILPEGQIDYPCAKGVDDAQQNAIVAIGKLAKSYGAF